VLQDEHEKKVKKSAHIQAAGADKKTGAVDFNQTLIDKI
jgi:hypothetical protein